MWVSITGRVSRRPFCCLAVTSLLLGIVASFVQKHMEANVAVLVAKSIDLETGREQILGRADSFKNDAVFWLIASLGLALTAIFSWILSIYQRERCWHACLVVLSAFTSRCNSSRFSRSGPPASGYLFFGGATILTWRRAMGGLQGWASQNALAVKMYLPGVAGDDSSMQ